MKSYAAAWFVHLYTASGALFAFLALTRIFEDRYQEAFAWLLVTVIIDATDGIFARWADVARRLPGFDGRKLDDIVDYLAYVFVPAAIVWHARLVPDAWLIAVVTSMLLSSAYRFNRDDAKTADHLFTGFPSYWNIVVFYLYLARWTPAVNAAILLALAALVFVPIRYVYPSRTPPLRVLTISLGILWGALVVVMLAQLPEVSPSIFLASLLFPVYYFLLSLALELRRRSR
jgi:phosphatidylcholine synthase